MLIEHEILAAIVARYESEKAIAGDDTYRGFLSGLLTAEGIIRKIIKEHEL